jgi:hypothetical protein
VKRLNTEMAEIDRMLVSLIEQATPSLLELYGVGTDPAATLLVAAGDNPDRLHSERSWAHLCMRCLKGYVARPTYKHLPHMI